MSQRISGFERQSNEHYPTPDWVARVVAPHLRLRGVRRIWAPADDRASKLVHALRSEGFSVLASCSNFLAAECSPEVGGIDCICTNPPYGTGGRLASRFISHALDLAPVTAMLLKIDFDSGKTRTHLFRDCKAFAGKIILLDRIVWFEREGAAGPSDNHCWLIWDKHHRGPPTISYAGRGP